MRALKFIIVVSGMCLCAYLSPTRLSANTTTALPPYAQFVAHIKPLVTNPSITGPIVKRHLVPPAPKDVNHYVSKLKDLLNPDPHCGELGFAKCPESFTQNDYLMRYEVAAEFTVHLENGDSVVVVSPIVNDQVPDSKTKWVFPADSDSKGSPLEAHSVEEIAYALAELPPETRAFIKEVAVLSHRSPYDAAYTQILGRPMRAYMQALSYPLGVIIIPPQPQDDPPEVPMMSSILAHEAGHVWSFGCFGETSSTELWNEWRRAMASDGTVISEYAEGTFLEDVAEMALVYAAVISYKGTEQGKAYHAQLSSQFPNRWKLLDTYYPTCGK